MKKILLSALSVLSLTTALAQTPFFTKTCYRGAFAPAPTPMWTNTWTEWDPQNKIYPVATVTVNTNITASATWSTGQTVLIQGPIYVKNNAVLTIQPGVTVLGSKATAQSALIITKGSQLIANGTAAQPIVFTSDQAPGLRGLGDWGGIILLGKATNNNSGGIGNIEGLPISVDTEYGGGTTPDDNDNSGSLQYIRIEYSGQQFQPNQEINGLTMGGVGRATVLDFIQVSYNNDDAFEWFAGTVNAKHLVSYRNIDDDFDTDYGWSGNVQWGLAVRDPQLADNPSISTSEFFESDNDPTGTAATPKTRGIFCNMTCIGPLRGVSTATYASGHRTRTRIRRNSELKIYNSILTDQATRGLFIDGSACENNTNAGLLKFKNNILAGYGVRATEQGTANIINTNTFVIANANDTLGKLVNASSILVTPYNYLAPDYRPSVGSLALSNVSFTDAVLAGVTGTFASNNLVAGIPSTICIGDGTITIPSNFTATSTLSSGYCSMSWSVSAGVIISNTMTPNPSFTITTAGTHTITLLVTDANGNQSVVNSVVSSTCVNASIKEANNSSIGNIVLFPNPTSNMSILKVNSTSTSVLSVTLSDITGKVVSVPVEAQALTLGENWININTNELSNGVYFVTINNGLSKETVKLIVNH
jgi:hypothetical protein